MTRSRSSIQRVHKAAEYEVYLSDSAADAYGLLFLKANRAEEGGEPGSIHCANFRHAEECIDEIIPRDPFNKKCALSGDLRTIYRLRKGRLRICWVASPSMKRIDVICISEMPSKEGGSNDPYALLSRRVAAGEFDGLLQKLGVKPRARQVTERIQ